MSADDTNRDARTDLLHRSSGGLDITLLWDSSTGVLTLEVYDRNLRWRTACEVPPDRARYAFHHPFAFACEQSQPLPMSA